MDFGIQTGQQHRSYDDLLALWRAAESSGYSHAWLYDHFIPVGGPLDGDVFEAWTLLSSLLSRTRTIRGGILVSCVMYREPAVVAKQAVTIDHASAGRLDVGVGSCWNAWEADLYGIGFPPHRERHERLLEAIDVMHAMWSQDEATVEGRHYRVSGALARPRPVQEPHPPIWVGGTGKLIGEAVAKADGWNAIFLTLDEYRGHLARVRAACEETGRDPATVRLSFGQRVSVDPDPEVALARAQRMYADQNVPFDEHLRDRMFIGTPEQVAAQVAALRDLGVDQFITWHEPPFDAEAEDQLHAFAETVIPLL